MFPETNPESIKILRLFSWLTLVVGCYLVFGIWTFLQALIVGIRHEVIPLEFSGTIVRSVVLFLSGLANIIAFFGLIKMKRWALYLVTSFTFLVLAARLLYPTHAPYFEGGPWIVTIVSVVSVTYFWTLYKQLK